MVLLPATRWADRNRAAIQSGASVSVELKALKGHRLSDLKLIPSLIAMLEHIERHSGSLLMLAVTASGGREYNKLNKLRSAGYVVKCDHPSVVEGAWPAEALAITETGRTALVKYRIRMVEKKGRRRSMPKTL